MATRRSVPPSWPCGRSWASSTGGCSAPSPEGPLPTILPTQAPPGQLLPRSSFLLVCPLTGLRGKHIPPGKQPVVLTVKMQGGGQRRKQQIVENSLAALGCVTVWRSPTEASLKVYIFVHSVGWQVPAAPHTNMKVCSSCSVVVLLDLSCSVCWVYLSINVCASTRRSPCRALLDAPPSACCSTPS